MSIAQPQLAVGESVAESAVPEITVFSHSQLIYWWPVWLVGFILAALTYLQGTTVQFGDVAVMMHPSKSLGVVYTVVFVMVILMTNMTVRGTASLTVIIAVLALTFFFAYMDWWDDILDALGTLAMYMNLGYYVFFSSAVFVHLAAVHLHLRSLQLLEVPPRTGRPLRAVRRRRADPRHPGDGGGQAA